MANARLRELTPRQKETGFTQLSLHPFLHVCSVQVKFERTRVRRVVANHTLYTGVEYGLTNNSKLAERFFSQALEIAPDDPFVLHELGVTSFQKSEYEFTFARISEARYRNAFFSGIQRPSVIS